MKGTSKKRKRERELESENVEDDDFIATNSNSYGLLVKSLKPRSSVVDILQKKISKEQQGIEDSSSSDEDGNEPLDDEASDDMDEHSHSELDEIDEANNADHNAESSEEDADIGEDVTDGQQSDEDNESSVTDGDFSDEEEEQTNANSNQHDEFCLHFEQVVDEDIISQVDEKQFVKTERACPTLGCVQETGLKGDSRPTKEIGKCVTELKDACVKEKILKSMADDTSFPTSLTELQQQLFQNINAYKDVFYSQRNFDNGEQIRLVYCLHALNHILKTRARVLKNNSKLAASSHGSNDEDDALLRDQGLTRPKVLIVTPFREGARRIVNLLIKLAMPGDAKGQVMQKKRFHDEFKSDADERPSKATFRPSRFNCSMGG